jgi:hypothetical protein
VRTASVSITDNAPASPQTVPLSGRATFFEWSPRYMNMGNQKVGTSSAARTVKLTNAGTAPIAIFSIGIGGVNLGDFSQTNTCGTGLKAGASCTIEVTFTPTAVGSRLGHVAIRDNAFGGTHWVGLLGKGTAVPKEFVMPVTGQLYLQQMGGSAGAVTTFGLGTTPGNFVPYYTGLPNNPNPTGEVLAGSFAAGTTIHFGMFTQYGSESGWAFSNGTDQASIVAFTDVDDSLGLGGSIIQQTSANTWLLHLDDALSYLFDDDDNDVLMQLRVAAGSSK